MRARHLIAFLLVPAALSSACVTSTTTSRTWDTGGGWVRYGHVESIRETVHRQQGDPAAGAVAGALIGGVMGSLLGGHYHHDRWGGAYHASTAGAVAGAVGGAMVGAAASSGSAEERSYEVFVRFDDGAYESFFFRGGVPFRIGEPVSLTPEGLVRS